MSPCTPLCRKRFEERNGRHETLNTTNSTRHIGAFDPDEEYKNVPAFHDTEILKSLSARHNPKKGPQIYHEGGFAWCRVPAENMTAKHLSECPATYHPNTDKPGPKIYYAPRTPNPSAHLRILRDPTKCHTSKRSPAFSATLGNNSDAYLRLIERQYRNAQIFIENWEIHDWVDSKGTMEPKHFYARAEHYDRAERLVEEIEADHEAEVFLPSVVDRWTDKMQAEAKLWKHLKKGEARDFIKVTDKYGDVTEKCVESPIPEIIGREMESLMNCSKRSLKEYKGLKENVRKLWKDAMKMRMVDMEKEEIREEMNNWPATGSQKADEKAEVRPSKNVSITSSKYGPLELAIQDLKEYRQIRRKALHLAKLSAVNLLVQGLDEEADAKDKRHRTPSGSATFPQRLRESITDLRLRMADDGLVPSDATGLHYKASDPTLPGPGAVTFVGPIRNVIQKEKDVLDYAYDKMCVYKERDGVSKKNLFEKCIDKDGMFWEVWKENRSGRRATEWYNLRDRVGLARDEEDIQEKKDRSALKTAFMWAWQSVGEIDEMNNLTRQLDEEEKKRKAKEDEKRKEQQEEEWEDVDDNGDDDDNDDNNDDNNDNNNDEDDDSDEEESTDDKEDEEDTDEEDTDEESTDGESTDWESTEWEMTEIEPEKEDDAEREKKKEIEEMQAWSEFSITQFLHK